MCRVSTVSQTVMRSRPKNDFSAKFRECQPTRKVPYCHPKSSVLQHHLRQAGAVAVADQTLGEYILVLRGLSPASASAAVSLSRVSIVAGARGIYGIGSGNALSTRDKTVDNERDRGRLTENSRPQMT